MGKSTSSGNAASARPQEPQAQGSFVASEKKYRLLIENANEIIYTLTLDGVITYASPAMKALLGHTVEQVIGKRMEEFIHPDDISRCEAFLDTVIRTGQRKAGIEFRVLQADGAWRWLSSSGVPERDEAGAIIGYQGIARDITEKKRLLDTLAEREDHFRMLFEQAPIPYQSLDIEGNILEVNSRWLSELGYDRAEVIGKWFGDFLQPDSLAAFAVNFPRFKAAGSVTGVVFNMTRKDGSAITVSFNGRISHDKQGNFRQTHCIFSNITEQKRAEEERGQLLAMIDKSLNEIYVFDEATLKISYANEGALRNLGYSMDELAAMTSVDLKPLFTEASFRAAVQPLISKERPRLIFETIHRRKDGTTYPIEVHLQLMGDQTKPTFLAIINDITERKKAEDALRESEEMFRNVFELSPIGKTMTAEDGSLRVNKAFAEMLGYSMAELETINWMQLTYPEDIGKSDAAAQALINGKEKRVSFEKRYIHKNGSIVCAQLTIGLLGGIASAPQFFLTSAEDITERKKAEEELRQNESRLKRLVDILQHQSETIQGFLDYALEQAIQLTGSKIGYIYYYSEERKEFVLNTWSKDVMAECAVIDPLSRYELDKTGFWGEAVRQRKPIIANDFPDNNPLKKGAPEGHVRLLKFMTVPVFRDQKIVGVVGLANKAEDYNETDILQTSLLMEAVWKVVERKTAEEEIRALNAELEERVLERTMELTAANKELESFSYSVSHDLRAPLRSIEGFSSIFLDEYGASIPEKGREYLERVRRNALRMGQLIDDILELTRIGRSELRMGEVDLSALAAEVVAELVEQNPKRDVAIEIEPGMTATGDPQLLRIVLANLLGNAWKFTSKREHAHVVMGRLVDPEHGPAFFIRDDGVGFDNAYKGRLFVAFQRLHAEQDFPGTGIGLANVQRVVRRHGGEVWAEGEIGKGATFCFSIPEA